MFQRHTNRLFIAAIAAGLMTPLAKGADPVPADRAPGNSNALPGAVATPDASDRSDRQFVTKAATGGLLEVKLGELAQQKASASDVKQFGQKMVDDHGKANDELKQLAQQKRIEVPSELTGEAKEHYDKFAKLSGNDFDQKYVAMMVRDHKEDIADFEKEAKNGNDPDAKAWAAKTLPTLKSHREMIQKIALDHGIDTARTAGDKQLPEAPNQGNVGNQPTNPGGTGTTGNPPATPGNNGNQPNNQGNTGTQPQQPGTPAPQK